MKNENKNNYYNYEDEVNFEKLDNFKKFNSDIKKNTQFKNQDIKYSNSDKNYFNNIIKTGDNLSVLNETDIKKNTKYYNSSDSQKFDQLNNFPDYKYNTENKDESINPEFNYSTKDYDEFNKIIETKDIEKKITSNQKKRIKIIDYSKLKESEKKIKNKLEIEKIKVVYFD